MNTPHGKVTLHQEYLDDERTEKNEGRYEVCLNGKRIGLLVRDDTVSNGYWGRFKGYCSLTANNQIVPRPHNRIISDTRGQVIEFMVHTYLNGVAR